MSVITRIDSRSKTNNGFQVRDLNGNVLVWVEALSPETQLRIGTSDKVVVVKSNGAELTRKR